MKLLFVGDDHFTQEELQLLIEGVGGVEAAKKIIQDMRERQFTRVFKTCHKCGCVMLQEGERHECVQCGDPEGCS